MSEQRSLRAALVALHALPAVSSRYAGPIGGTETRAWTLARGLAARESSDSDRTIAPSLVVRSPKEHVPSDIDGVSIETMRQPLYDAYLNVGRCLERKPGFPPWRLRKLDWRLAWQLPIVAADRILRWRNRDPRVPNEFFSRLKCDVLVGFGVQSTSATVIASARSVGKPSVVMLGCNDDLDGRYATEPDWVNPYGDSGHVCSWILKQADVVVVQTEWQAAQLRERFGRDGVLLRNPLDVRRWQELASHPVPGDLTIPDRFLLWVGRSEGVHKRPQLVVELAKRCPDIPFVVVMNKVDPDLDRDVRSVAPQNVQFVEHVPPDEMPALMRRSSGLVNTSVAEGFPNTFLQMATLGRPVLSLGVLGEFLAAHRFGLGAGGDLDRLAEAARTAYAAKTEEDLREIGFDATHALDYVAREHDVAPVVDRFAHVLVEAVEANFSPG